MKVSLDDIYLNERLLPPVKVPVVVKKHGSELQILDDLNRELDPHFPSLVLILLLVHLHPGPLVVQKATNFGYPFFFLEKEV